MQSKYSDTTRNLAHQLHTKLLARQAKGLTIPNLTTEEVSELCLLLAKVR